ncbi:hypothetical protein Hanom_Chr10g00932581 [Helianthus anomalus]
MFLYLTNNLSHRFTVRVLVEMMKIQRINLKNNFDFRACLGKLIETIYLLIGFLEKSGFCDLLTYWLFPLTYTLFAKHHFRAYDFSKSQ